MAHRTKSSMSWTILWTSIVLVIVVGCTLGSNSSLVHAAFSSHHRRHPLRQTWAPAILTRLVNSPKTIPGTWDSKNLIQWQLFSQNPWNEDHIHNNDDNENPAPDDDNILSLIDSTTGEDVQPRVYPQRWIQLACLSALALMSDWICFSVAAAPETYELVYQHSSASLIDLFLFTNVASCFLVTDVVAKIGLERAVKNSAVLMTIGCWLRSGIAFWNPIATTTTTTTTAAVAAAAAAASSSSSSSLLVSYPWVVVGTILVGAAQPFFQCTPPVLSALWFADTERATSTAVALNFNQVGIATAFLVGGAMATDVPGLAHYFGLIAIVCTIVTIATLWQFQEEPPVPPSASELEKKISGKKEPPFLESVQKFFQTRGFSKALAAFICSISITNIVGAFIAEIMERGGITDRLQIDLSGAAFEFAIVLGGILIGGYVDRTKKYKFVTLACLAATLFTIIPLGLTEHRIGQGQYASDDSKNHVIHE
jgi:FLVCR family feline leukemia virus subgroup C receptor-related protein